MIQTFYPMTNRKDKQPKQRPPLEPILASAGREYPADVLDYFSFYGLDFLPDTAEHLFGSFSSGKYTLAAHLYKPAEYQAAVVLLHGYLNHTGQLKHVIRDVLEKGYAVAAFDLPGHGLSTGQSARIDDFEEYVQALKDFMEIVRSQLHGPFHAVGFSTGASILLDLLLTGRSEPFDKTILAAPLIHWTAYEQSKATYKVYKIFTNKIARFHQKNSSDKEYLIFNRTKDYLHAEHVSLFWVKALFDWNRKINNLPPCNKKILILQGDQDSTVEWEHNMSLVRKKLPNAEIQMVDRARHELFNESLPCRQKVLDSVINWLDNKGNKD